MNVMKIYYCIVRLNKFKQQSSVTRPNWGHQQTLRWTLKVHTKWIEYRVFIHITISFIISTIIIQLYPEDSELEKITSYY